MPLSFYIGAHGQVCHHELGYQVFTHEGNHVGYYSNLKFAKKVADSNE